MKLGLLRRPSNARVYISELWIRFWPGQVLRFVKCKRVLIQGGAGEAERVGGPAEPGKHVRHSGKPEESV